MNDDIEFLEMLEHKCETNHNRVVLKRKHDERLSRILDPIGLSRNKFSKRCIKVESLKKRVDDARNSIAARVAAKLSPRPELDFGQVQRESMKAWAHGVAAHSGPAAFLGTKFSSSPTGRLKVHR